jgi:preprotein translocase subunit SecF
MTKRSEKRMKLKKKFFSQDSNSEKPVLNSDNSNNIKSNTHKNKFLNFYHNNYKALLIIPILMLLLSIAQISYQTITTGDFINKDISLKGGITITVPVDTNIDIDILLIQNHLTNEGFQTNVRNLQSAGTTIGFLVESDIDLNDQESLNSLIDAISLKYPLIEEEYSVEGVGASIGESFFKQAMLALLISFLIMAIIVAITFKTFIPSIGVIASAVLDLIVTIAIVNIMGINVSTAGLAALLMMIGYSVDIDILLTTNVLKRKEGSIFEKIAKAFKTGVLMSFTTFIAIIVALFITSSEVIKQIMIILLIGLLVDQVSTWIQNVGILRLYLNNLEKKKKENQNEA